MGGSWAIWKSAIPSAVRAIATRGRSYGEFFVGACWSREGWGSAAADLRFWVYGLPFTVRRGGLLILGFTLSRADRSSTILKGFDLKMVAIATQGRSYGEFFVGACWSREGWGSAAADLRFWVYGLRSGAADF